MRVKAEQLTPGHFLVGDGKSRLYVKYVGFDKDNVYVYHHWGTLTFHKDEEVEAARPDAPRPLPAD